MLALLSFLSAPSLKEIQLVFELRLQVCLYMYIQDGRHFEWYQKSIWRAITYIILRSPFH